MANHIIHKQVFDLALKSESNAWQIQENAKKVFNDKSLSLLDGLFNRVTPKDSVYRFDRIEIDLGKINPDELEEALLNNLPLALEEELKMKIHAHNTGYKNNGKEIVSNFAHSSPDGLQVIPDDVSRFEALLFYLKTGIMPWWISEESKLALSEMSSVELLFKDLKEEQLLSLLQIFDEPGVLQRLTKQCITSINEVLRKEKTTETKDDRQTLLSLILSKTFRVIEDSTDNQNLTRKIKTEILRRFINPGYLLETVPVNTDIQTVFPKIKSHFEMMIHVLIDTLEKEGFTNGYTARLLEKIHLLFGREFISEQLANMQVDEIKKDVKPTDGNHNLKENTFDQQELKDMLQEGIYIENAGVILLWPFFKEYFLKLGMIKNGDFISDEAKNRAVLLIHYIVNGNTEYHEYELALNKILCGLSVSDPVVDIFDVSDEEDDQAGVLLQTTIDSWPAIGKIGIQGFRSTFLKRNGRLQLMDFGWNLKINRGAFDMLLDRLPWSISIVKNNWMNEVIYVEW